MKVADLINSQSIFTTERVKFAVRACDGNYEMLDVEKFLEVEDREVFSWEVVPSSFGGMIMRITFRKD